ncbi:hypothetical protein FQN57_006509 [Myotisia sp. PD_48]|nr:hypothetical protein FQN57_006509 [Myotisia sp. PD_48]
MAPIPPELTTSPGELHGLLTYLDRLTSRPKLETELFQLPNPLITRTLETTPQLLGRSSSLAPRTQMVSIPNTYNGPDTSPGIVVAAVLISAIVFFGLFVVLRTIIYNRLYGDKDTPEEEPRRPSRSQRPSTRAFRPAARKPPPVHHQQRRQRPEVVEVMSASDQTESYDTIYDDEDDFEDESYISQRRGGYKPVNPHQHGGGHYPQRPAYPGSPPAYPPASHQDAGPFPPQSPAPYQPPVQSPPGGHASDYYGAQQPQQGAWGGQPPQQGYPPKDFQQGYPQQQQQGYPQQQPQYQQQGYPQQGMYYPQQGGPPPPQGHYVQDNRGSKSTGICAAIFGTLACCCCLDMIF